ncbi:MAG: polymerase, sigma-24 subunit, subfamily [Ferruginibacter sp.]|nr:polymerase, sigma-24 subunit, subfamily [Ferruginibacter sp.]
MDMAKAFQAGDEKALAFFHKQLYIALAHYAFQVTRSRPLAEELASDALLKAWRMRSKLNQPAGIKAYLYRIVHRDSVRAAVAEKKRAGFSGILPQSIELDTAYDAMVRTEVYRLVHTALQDLSPSCRKVVIMQYIEGKTTGQISRELNLHPSTIKTQKSRALKNLHRIITVRSISSLWIFAKIFLPFL